MGGLKVNKLVAEAEKLTGLHDWGTDEHWLPLDVLVKAISADSNLSEEGKTRAERRIIQRLCQRLKLFEDRKRRPEISAQIIDAPVMVVGMPRAGTTYTHALLASDPSNIAPLGWQFHLPSPPPNDPTIDHGEQVREAYKIIEDLGCYEPQVKRLHDFDVLRPEECGRAMELSFYTISFLGYWSIPEYFWAMANMPENCVQAYQTHKKVLQALQVGVEGRRWILKAPEHTTQLESLLKVYPDAMLVQNHRDPSRVMASVMSLIRALQALSSNNPPDLSREFAISYMRSFADAQNRLIELRQNPDIDKHFVDVHYLDLEKTPMAVMETIYSATGMDFNSRAQTAVSEWIDTNRKGAYGKHRYSLADINVTQEEGYSIFRNYLDYFKVELEAEIQGVGFC